MNRYKLTARFDSRQGFYGKAIVVEDGGNKKLYSYDTLVAEIFKTNSEAKVYNTQSQTTVRHVKEFLKQNGFRAESKKQIEKDYK